MVKCPEKLQWLIPYYEEVKPYLPKHKLTHINHASLAKGKLQLVEAQIWKIKYSYNFEITMYTEYWKTLSLKPFRRTRKPYSKIDLLVSFAHELAHIQHFSVHCPKHKSLEAMFIAIFMSKLERSGYVSEEDELKQRGVKL